MMPKSIDLSNKCGSCCHFEPIEGTCSGYCLRNKYGENVVCDPAHPYWQVQRSRLKCVDYNKKPKTNADHIRSLGDEELSVLLAKPWCENHRSKEECLRFDTDCQACVADWLRRPYEEDT